MTMKTSTDYSVNCDRASQALQQRRRMLEESELSSKTKTKTETKKLVSALSEQVQLDEKLRNCKLWFKACKTEDKNKKVRNLLDIQGISISA